MCARSPPQVLHTADTAYDHAALLSIADELGEGRHHKTSSATAAAAALAERLQQLATGKPEKMLSHHLTWEFWLVYS